MRFRLLIPALACLTAGIEAAPHRRRLFPEPSTSVLAMAEGKGRVLWLATNNGLYLFDGFHHQRVTSYPFASARFVAVTRDGTVWAGGIEGLARSAGGRFEVVLREEVKNFAALPDRVFVRLDVLAAIELDGTVRRLPHLTRRDLYVDSKGQVWGFCMNPNHICAIDGAHPDRPAEMKAELSGYDSAFPASAGRIWAANDLNAALIAGNSVVSTFERQRGRESRRAGPLLAGHGDRLWFLGDPIRLLEGEVEFRDDSESSVHSPLSGLEDSRGRVWVAREGQGLAEWTREGGWQRWFPEDYGGGAATQVVRSGDSVYLATHAGVYRLGGNGAWTRVSENLALASLLAIDGGEFLGSLRSGGIVRLSRDGLVVERLPAPSTNEEFRELVRDGRGQVWAGSKRWLYRLEGRAGAMRAEKEALTDLPEGVIANPADLEVDSSGRLWAGYNAGVAFREDTGTWRRIPTQRPVESVRSFAPGADNVWVAYRRAGEFSRLHRTSDRWSVEPFAAHAGFGPVDTHFIKRDSRGWIWRGSPEGVHVSDGVHTGRGDWLHIHSGNGLAGNDTDQFGFFEDRDGSVWIAGARGVTWFQPNKQWFEPAGETGPAVTRLDADGRSYIFPEAVPRKLPGAVRSLRIDAGGLDAPVFRKFPLEYRLLPRETAWSSSADGVIEYSNLNDNNYRLELRWAGGPAAQASVLAFRVGSGPSMPWTAKAGLLAGAGLLIPLFRYSRWYDRSRYKVEKALFLLRRRYSKRRFDSSPSGAAATIREHTGSILAGRYRLERVLSSGGFSVVYEASDLRNATPVAIKILNRRAGVDDGAVNDRFAHEVAALRSVEHSGVVPILDSWITRAGEPCLAMPFLDGITLRSALAQGPLGASRAHRLLRQLGDALTAIHERGIVHRDLKPENIMLLDAGTAEERSVILDFGTAGLLGRDMDLASTTLMAGSFHYMAPERLTGHYSAASDVFSLGVIVLEMLTGKRLSDLKAMYFDPEFGSELQQALADAVPAAGVADLAERLARAFDPEPRRRPAGLQEWTEGLMRALAYVK